MPEPTICQRYHLGDAVLVMVRHLPSKRTKTDAGAWRHGRVTGAKLALDHETGSEMVLYDVRTSRGQSLIGRNERDLQPVSVVDSLANVARRADARR